VWWMVVSLAASVPAEFTFARADQPAEAEIARALETVKTDPNLATLRTIKMLRWKNPASPKRPGRLAWLSWIVDLFKWVDQSARLIIWGAALALVGWLVVYIVRTVRSRRDVPVLEKGAVAPRQVRDLDIRPESLPDDIGAAARRLWDRSEHRAALALLYRGMLSRFAHVHRIPIRDSSTERDCLALAARHLPAAQSEYASRLVGEWQRLVYGSQDIQTPMVYRLCDGFAPALDEAATPVELGDSA
jgi:hypothetical protein